MIKGIVPGQGPRIEPGQARAPSGGEPVARAAAVNRVASADEGVSTLTPLVAAGAPFDADKVARLKNEIARGSYQVDPDRIADAMIAFDLPPKPHR